MHIYTGIFFTALATLVYEITLLRILSVMSWYHLAFFAVSTAMLGMTGGAVTVYLNKKAFEPENLNNSYIKAAIAFAVSLPVSLTLLCFTPIVYQHNIASVTRILLAAFYCIIPYYFSGIVITAILTREEKPVGKLYGADLGGAAIGCLAVILGLEFLSAPNMILFAAVIASIGAFIFSIRSKGTMLKSASMACVALVLAVFIGNIISGDFISPRTIKGHKSDTRKFYFQKWNSFSWVNVSGMEFKRPYLWGTSPITPDLPVKVHGLSVDGEAGTFMLNMDDMANLEVLKYDMVNLAHYIRPNGGSCVIGVGGGRDITSSIVFGHDRVVGIEVNPIFIKLLKGKFRDFAGLADRPGVELVADEARSYLARSTEKFNVITMALIDTWAATGAGAFTLSENGLYTVEAWKVFLDRLNDGGVFTVSRWFSEHQPGETARIVNLAVTALYKRGVSDPSKHIVLTAIGNIATLLVSNKPFSDEDLKVLRETAERLKFKIFIFPGQEPENEWLRKIITGKSIEEINALVKDAPLNYTAPTDERPYFFNMIKLNNLSFAWRYSAGGISGNMVANITLLILIGALMFFVLAVIVVPLLAGAKKDANKVDYAPAFYFALIGAGFMFVQIAMVQRLSVFLGHPVYALGILLFTMILSAGIGSLVSEKIAITKPPLSKVYPVVIGGYIITLALLMPVIISAMTTFSMAAKIASSIGMVAPLAFVMGMCFPAGMRMISGTKAAGTPWYWALNGIFGVFASAVVVLISIYSGITTNFYIGALCYLSLLFFIPKMQVMAEVKAKAEANVMAEEKAKAKTKVKTKAKVKAKAIKKRKK